MVMQIVIGMLRIIHKGFEKENRNHWTNRERSNYSIIEIGQNIEKSLGDLRRVAVTQTPVKDHKLTLVWKTSNNNDNNNNIKYVDIKEKYEKSTSDKRQRFSKPSSTAEIFSKG